MKNTLAVFFAFVFFGFAGTNGSGQTESPSHPSLYVTVTPQPGLRSLADVRRGIREGHARRLWEELLAKVDRESREAPIATRQHTPLGIVEVNRDIEIVARASNRIMDAALAALVLDEPRYAAAAFAQVEALFDRERWPEWAHQDAIARGMNADLRHGHLVLPVALAYDWLYHLLTPEQRRQIIDGLDRCAIRRFKAGVAAREHWSERRSNWMTTVVGGFGIAGMALGKDHPDSEWLVEFARPRMESYLSVVGPEGEFNESVQYSGSMAHVVRYFTAVRYATAGRDNPFARHSLSNFYRWYTHMIFPPGRVAGFGDPAPDMPPVVSPAAAVASALQDPLLQWLYVTYCDQMGDTHRQRALELLYFDADLPVQSPEGQLPLGRAYRHEAMLISSRSSWDPQITTSAVYAKAARETYHSHADWGQVCIDGYGEQLVVDLKASYPNKDKDRHYEYQQWGHNVFVFGRNATGGVPLAEHRRRGTIVRADFDPERGGAWTLDLTGVYASTQRVTRSVVHLLPRIVVVLDDAQTREPQPISLRWHLAGFVEPQSDGSFQLHKGRAQLRGRMLRLDGPAKIGADRHRYDPPYDRDSAGNLKVQRHEPFIELAAEDAHCRVLTLFCILGPGSTADWLETPEGWRIATPEGDVIVSLLKGVLRVQGANRTQVWTLPLDERVP